MGYRLTLRPAEGWGSNGFYVVVEDSITDAEMETVRQNMPYLTEAYRLLRGKP